MTYARERQREADIDQAVEKIEQAALTAHALGYLLAADVLDAVSRDLRERVDGKR
jgi:hypothetical protein